MPDHPRQFRGGQTTIPVQIFLGQPALNALRAIPFSLHLNVKFSTLGGIAEVHGDPEVARTCYLDMLRGQEKVVAQTISLEPYIPGEKARQLGAQDGIEEFPLREDRPDRVLRIGASLPSEEKEGLKTLLREYSRVFAWTVEDMPGIPTDLAVHHLNVDPRFKPVKQKKRSFTPEGNEVIKKKGRQAAGIQNHPGGILPNLVSQLDPGEEGGPVLEDVRGLHRS